MFCKIAAGDIPAEVVLDTDQVVAFRDLNPQAPTHVLVIPRAHAPNAGSTAAQDEALVGKLVTAAAEVAVIEGLDSYRMVFNTGADAGQTVFHTHLHVLGGRSFQWPPG